jgi:hypothetical protein
MEKLRFVDMVNYNGEPLSEKKYDDRVRTYIKSIHILLIVNIFVWSALIYFLF